jgi:hypothetical protein
MVRYFHPGRGEEVMHPASDQRLAGFFEFVEDGRIFPDMSDHQFPLRYLQVGEP